MSRVKECFASRFPGGVLMEVDFSQLEVAGVAILSQDPMLIHDIVSGQDMHRNRAAELFGVLPKDVSAEQRQYAKRLSFQLQYGAGAKAMAEKNELPLEIAEKFVKLYYDRYEVLKQWQDNNIETVKKGRSISPARTTAGEPAGVSTLDSPTGRFYTFTEYDAPEWMREKKVYRAATTTSFSPTQIKNYPSQGFATGDVMAVFRAEILRYYRHRNLFLATAVPVITVHDSVMFDCSSEAVSDDTFKACKQIADSLPKLLEEKWGINCPISFKVERKIGGCWSSMKKPTKDS